MEAPRETILQRIQKLQRLANHKNTCPEEAAAAAGMVQKLLLEHNLSIEEAVDRPELDEIEHTMKDLGGKGSAVRWRRTLLHCLAKAHMCETCYMIGDAKTAVVGRKGNVEVVLYMYDYLSRDLHRMACEALRVSDYRDAHAGPKGAWVNSFCLGACSTIWKRLEAQKEAARTATAQSQALMVVNDKQVALKIKQIYPNMSSGKKDSARVSADAYQEGKKAGEKVSLLAGIKGHGEQAGVTSR